ncbi:TKL/TKL-ccin protein kinase, variant 2 [Coprinopsis cinerea AmutBmut pab1-1]|nr:TKL/TKL-ccin protein kinase, variant 2 [Coprinopsis cinerea AmutBmut pab1-1]
MMAKDLVSGILGAVELGANVAGVPFAAGAALILKEIVDTCDQLRIHKKARTIRNKCVQFTLLLDDHSRTNIDAELLKSIDETRAIFERVYSRMHRYSQMSAWSLFLKMSEIGEGLDECEANVQSAIEMFQFAAHAVGNRNQQEIKETMRVQHEEMRALLREVLTKPSEAREIIAMQRSGSQVAQQVMQAGQEQLRNELMISNTRSESPTREGRDQEATTQKRRPGSDIRDALYQFHLQTGTLPAIKILNEEITRRSDHAVAGGTHSDIWEGLWLGRKKVALKGLRNIKADDPRAKLRIEREIKTWSSLQNEHILPFYGIVTDIGTHIHMKGFSMAGERKRSRLSQETTQRKPFTHH